MGTYWVLFALPAIAALMNETPRTRWLRTPGKGSSLASWLVVVAILTLIIGLRYEVGGDWFNYFHYLYNVQGVTPDEVLLMPDPGFQLLNWLSNELDWDVFGVNLFSGFIFSIGLAVFCRSLPRPWLALAVAVPYLLIVVAMGYSRQGVALGLALMGLVALGKHATGRFVFWVLLAATFHKTAVVLLPLAALAAARNRWLALTWSVASLALGYWLFLEDSVERLYVNYVEAEYQSEGALVRLAMNVLPAGLLLVYRKKFAFAPAERNLWLAFAVISLAMFGVLFVSPSSTAVDRIALYMLPLQLVVFSHFPDVISPPAERDVTVPLLGVVAYYAAVEFVWLNFAGHSFAWVPYRFYPLEVVF